MSLIARATFADLHIGDTFCEVKGLDGAHASRVPAPVDWLEEIDELRKLCKEGAQAHGPEFSIPRGETLLRVTKVVDIKQEDVFFIRKSEARIRDIDDLSLADYVVDTWRNPKLRGLVLIAGEMGNGKTSTAASFIVDRLTDGGLCIAIEDPPEANLNGVHGQGRCVQVHASRKTGGYPEHIYHSMRTGADLIFIGEIRDQDTAFEAINASINGHLILATIHAGNCAQAVERIITYASGKMENAADVLATGLSMIVWQSLNRTHQGGRVITRMVFQPLVLTREDGLGIKEKIRQGKVQQIMQDVARQQSSDVWS